MIFTIWLPAKFIKTSCIKIKISSKNSFIFKTKFCYKEISWKTINTSTTIKVVMVLKIKASIKCFVKLLGLAYLSRTKKLFWMISEIYNAKNSMEI